jgi:hypothetical protein
MTGVVGRAVQRRPMESGLAAPLVWCVLAVLLVLAELWVC